jgi:hypothetical protein
MFIKGGRTNEQRIALQKQVKYQLLERKKYSFSLFKSLLEAGKFRLFSKTTGRRGRPSSIKKPADMKDYTLGFREDATTTERAVLNDFMELHGFCPSGRTASCARHVKHLAKGYKDFNLEEEIKAEQAKEESPLEEAAAKPEYSNSSEESPDKAQEAHEEEKEEKAETDSEDPKPKQRK